MAALSNGPLEAYGGMTKRRYKKLKAMTGTNSTPGREKGENCRCLPDEKGLTKYPRARKTFPILYREAMARQQARFTSSSDYFKV